MKRIELPESWRERAAVVTAVSDPRAWFDAAELAVVDRFAREKRRLEWMLSRIALKQLPDAPHVSFSHSRGYGAAAASHAPVGIDIEVVRHVDERAAHLFLSDDEQAAMRRCELPHRLLHFWAAKEAVWKERGGATPTLKQIPLVLQEQKVEGLRFDLAETFANGELVMALTLPREGR
jgi:phosphopantetheinyl transferase (holo-ACP synthase)